MREAGEGWGNEIRKVRRREEKEIGEERKVKDETGSKREREGEGRNEGCRVMERRGIVEIWKEVERWGRRRIHQENIQDWTFWKEKHTLNIHLKTEAKNKILTNNLLSSMFNKINIF